MSQVKPIPDGQSAITPHLVVKGAADAIAFYEKALGGKKLHEMLDPSSGKIMHAAVKFGDSQIYLADEFPEYCSLSPLALGGSPVVLHLYVEDVDAVFQSAVDAGATVKMPVMDMFWGDRYGKFVDPFGHEWSIATHIEDLTPEQMNEKMMEAMPAMAAN